MEAFIEEVKKKGTEREEGDKDPAAGGRRTATPPLPPLMLACLRAAGVCVHASVCVRESVCA